MIKKKSSRKSKVKVGKLNVNKETVQDLSGDDMEKVKGGADLTSACQSLICATGFGGGCPGVTAAGTPGCGGKTSGKKCNP